MAATTDLTSHAARPASGTGTINICLLHSFEVRVDGDVLALPCAARRVVAFLAVQHKRQERGRVAFALWTGAREEQARANLRRALWQLSGVRLLDAAGPHVGIGASVAVDAHELVRRAKRVIGGSCEGVGDVTVDDLIYDLLPGWDEEWLRFERERLRQLRLHALEALSDRLSLDGRHAEAIDAAQAAVAAEPLRESAQTALVRAHLAEDNLIEARRAFESYRSLLWNCLSCRPSERLRDLVFPGGRRRRATERRAPGAASPPYTGVTRWQTRR